ncbi:MAG: DNA primase, partial [Cryomorphaceae bacterium BACL22 MAG-120619-bin32]
VKENKQFDRFKGRVIFPIHSMSGRTLGFGGRILTNDKKAAKYLNSPESDIYHKGKVLYGIFQAKKEIAKQDNCFLVEGYTDVISFHQSGIENVVASSGTALTTDQIRLISRLTKNITVLFDGDAAGIRASIRGIDLILEQGMNVKVVQFPNGEDPDSFTKSHSDSELQEFLETAAQDFINFKVSLLLEEAQNDPVKKAGLIRDIVASISKIPDAIQREVYVQECARVMEISERILFSELAQLLSKNNIEDAKKNKAERKTFEVVKRQDIQLREIDQLEILEREIIKILLLYGNEEVDFIDEIIHINENGKEIKTPKKYKNPVSTEIYLQLHEDEINFTNLVFQEIYNEIIFQLNNTQKLEIDQLINHTNPIIASTVTSILMDEEKYQLSQWDRKNIFVTETKEVLTKAVTDSIYNIRRILIDKLLKDKSIKEKEYSSDEIEEIMNYNSLRIRLSEKLNRVV